MSTFGITQETRSEGTKLFNPPMKLDAATPQFPNKYKYPTGRLVNVICDFEHNTKNGETSVIQFIFKGSKGEVHTHKEWLQDKAEEKYGENVAKMNGRVKHILEQTGLDMPDGGIGVDAKDFNEYFTAIAKAFNDQVVMVDEKPVKKYYQKRLYIKLTYYKGNLNFPMFPDFIQAAEDNQGKAKVCDLTINHKYDTIEPDTTPSASFGGGTGGDAGAGDLPSFD